MEDIGDGYRSHELRPTRWQEIIGRTDVCRLYPEWVKPAVEAARVERRRLLIAISAAEERKRLMGEVSDEASRLRWETRNAHEAGQRNRAVSDEDVEVLSDTAWWAQAEYNRTDRAYTALCNALYRTRERLEAFDKASTHEHVSVAAHWHGPHCQTCKDANLALQALEARGPR